MQFRINIYPINTLYGSSIYEAIQILTKITKPEDERIRSCKYFILIGWTGKFIVSL